MKILFSMRHSGAIRNFESVLRTLAGRGHAIHLSFLMRDKIGDDRMAVGVESVVTQLAQDCPTITYSWLPKRSDAFWFHFSRAVRFCMDVLRYRLPAFQAADTLRERAEDRLPAVLRWLARRLPFHWRWFNRTVTGVLYLMEQAIPADPSIEEDLLSASPDIVLVTPLVDLGSDQVDYIKIARRNGIPSALCVHSWDNLTNKGLIRVIPDRVYVWNEAQRKEAVEHHGVVSDNVIVTGANTYDHWFEWQPSRSSDGFKKEVGLPVDGPFLLYLASSRFIAPEEVEFIERWIIALRRFGTPAVKEIGILVRPHPENRQLWDRLGKPGLGHVSVWPALGANPVNKAARIDYFDSLYHSRAVVGINTSGMIEAGIVGRPTFTILDPGNVGSQEGTLHFHHLVEVGDGLLHVASDFSEHLEQLTACLSASDDVHRKGEEFIREFVRPHGPDVRGTDRLVSGIEQLAASDSREPRRPGIWTQPTRWVLSPIAGTMRLGYLWMRRREKAQRRVLSGSLLKLLLTGPRKLLLKVFFRVLRMKRVRGVVNRYVVPRVMTGDRVYPEMSITEREVRRLASSGKTIVLGPWLSEVGFEVLYWIPFLNWAKEFAGLDADRLVAVSRGGVSHWYRTITNNYVEILEYMTTEHYLYNNLRRIHAGKQKQRNQSEFDTEVLRMAKEVMKEREFEVLHPSTMYNLLMLYWKRQASFRLADQFTEIRRHLPWPDSGAVSGLPDEYVAVRFYFNDSFPDTGGNRQFIANTLNNLTQHNHIVLLNPGFAMDDHHDFEVERRTRLHTVDELMTPQNNLSVQTGIIAQAKAFVGTYGGLSYLAPFYGVDSLAFYSERRGFHDHHLEFAQKIFRDLDAGTFLALDVSDERLIRSALHGDSLDTVTRLEN